MRIFLAVALLSVVAVLPRAASFAEDKPAAEIKTDLQKASYAVGVGIARNLRESQLSDVDLSLVARGMRDVFDGSKPLLTEDELKTAVTGYIAAEGKRKGDEFLAANKTKEGVKTTASGLQYKVLKSGDGATPKLDSRVTTHYRGTLIDGTEFDSSIARGQPAMFPVKGVIPGWTEALQLMKVGDKWELCIPAKLAYGERGNEVIPPNAVLIFEIELLDTKP